MRAIWATIIKELLELRRDRAGLLVLLVMPMALVLIVSLVQDNVMQATGQAPIKVLLVDLDKSALSEKITGKLKNADGLELIQLVKGKQLDEESAKKAVIKGDFQFAIIIPIDTGTTVKGIIKDRAEETFALKKKSNARASVSGAGSKLVIYFDPAVQGSFRTAVTNALQRIVLGVEFQQQATALAETFPKAMKKSLPENAPTPDISFKLDTEPVLKLSEELAQSSRLLSRPTAAQQNVPAWALFGMFFIVVPLSGTLIRERESGTFRRLMTMPVSVLSILTGKLIAYVIVCLLQFSLMLTAGIYLLPLLGPSGLEIGNRLQFIIPIAIVASLAATGYGLLIGTLAKTNEQASMFGAVSIVIAAALGGIMIPVYVMPRYMQDVSNISPLCWGLNAFQDIFVRGGDLRTTLPELSYLFIFFLISITVAGFALHNSRNR